MREQRCRYLLPGWPLLSELRDPVDQAPNRTSGERDARRIGYRRLDLIGADGKAAVAFRYRAHWCCVP